MTVFLLFSDENWTGCSWVLQ